MAIACVNTDRREEGIEIMNTAVDKWPSNEPLTISFINILQDAANVERQGAATPGRSWPRAAVGH